MRSVFLYVFGFSRFMIQQPKNINQHVTNTTQTAANGAFWICHCFINKASFSVDPGWPTSELWSKSKFSEDCILTRFTAVELSVPTEAGAMMS